MTMNNNDDKNNNKIIPKLNTTELSNNDYGVMFWEATHKCLYSCPMWEDCPYAGVSIKCDLCYRFLNEVKNAIIVSLEDNRVREYQKHFLGTGLFSLWNQWMQLEIIRISLESPMYNTPKGEPKVHPVYKAQREVFASIKNIYESVFGKEKAQHIADIDIGVDSLEKALRS